ncbi:hypothetical protein [Bartonella sp. LJL80]
MNWDGGEGIIATVHVDGLNVRQYLKIMTEFFKQDTSQLPFYKKKAFRSFISGGVIGVLALVISRSITIFLGGFSVENTRYFSAVYDGFIWGCFVGAAVLLAIYIIYQRRMVSRMIKSYEIYRRGYQLTLSDTAITVLCQGQKTIYSRGQIVRTCRIDADLNVVLLSSVAFLWVRDRDIETSSKPHEMRKLLCIVDG